MVAASAEPLARPRTGYRRPRRANLTGIVALGAAAAVAVTLVLPRLAAEEAYARSEGLNNANRGRESSSLRSHYHADAEPACGRGSATSTSKILTIAIVSRAQYSSRSLKICCRSASVRLFHVAARNHLIVAVNPPLMASSFEGRQI